MVWALAAFAGCGEEDQSIFLDASTSPSTSADARTGAGGDAGTGAPSGRMDAGTMQGSGAGGASVQIAEGELRGSVQNEVRRFLGIPYAKPPVGELRWKRPEKPAKWSTPRDATKWGKRCAQANSAVLMNPPSEDEDCLYLNVWAPKDAKDLPVMVWIHGGGNVNGSASEIVPYAPADSGLYFYDGEKLAQKGVVLVSINYRLGVFGFLSHPELDEPNKPSGNQGMWDQIAALEWVKSNIGKFGGDAKNVTIFGESAGSYDVCAQVASPKSKGLFHKAISQSGGCTTIMNTKQQAEATANALAQAVDCTGDEVLACLRDKDVPALLAATSMLPPATTSRTIGPTVDGDFLPEQPRTLYESGNFNKVPYLLGSNTDEGTLFTAANVITTEAQYDAALKMQYMSAAEAIKALYSLDKFADAKPNPAHAALSRVAGDARLVCTTTDTARLAAAHAPAVYTYNFDIPVRMGLSPTFLGATHGAELVYVFQTSPSFEEKETATSELMQRYWTNFARTGDPNGDDAPEWPTFSNESDRRMNFALDASEAVDAFRKAECDLWIAGYERTFEAASMAAP
jgi:para-nitrobenzyl esterase